MSLKMRCVGIGIYHSGPGGIEKPGDFGWRLDRGREQVDGIWRDKVDADTTQIVLHCPRTGVCYQYVREGPPGSHGEDGKQRWWAWDGNYESPTVTPSIGCDNIDKGRCGQHMVITNGEITGTCEYVRKQEKR